MSRRRRPTPQPSDTIRLAFTYQEAADALGVSLGTVKNWVYDGKLHAIKEGRTVRIPKTSIDEFLAAKS